MPWVIFDNGGHDRREDATSLDYLRELEDYGQCGSVTNKLGRSGADACYARTASRLSISAPCFTGRQPLVLAYQPPDQKQVHVSATPV